MKLLPEEDRRVQSFLVRYSQHIKFREMRHYIQHGRISTLEHCISVAKASLWLSRHLHMRVDEKALLTGALLHDFYLYDWHNKGTFHGLRRLFEMHGFSHPGCACINAERVFGITKKEQSIISSHMWPLTFRHVPTCREAIIVCLADKYCAVVESMFRRSHAGAVVDGSVEVDGEEW